MENNLQELVKFQLSRSIINLYKDYLIIAEDLHHNKNINNEKYSQIRKRILDKGNDTLRELETFINKFDFIKLDSNNINVNENGKG